MVVAEDGEPSGPPQKGRGVHGQYAYWITMPYPKKATVAKRGLKTPDPDEITRAEFDLARLLSCASGARRLPV